MSRLLIFLLLVTSIFASDDYKQIKIFGLHSEIKQVIDLGIALDHAHKSKDGGIVIFVSDSEFEQLSKLNIRTEILIDDWKKHYKERRKLTKIEQEQILQQTALKYNVTNFEFGSMGGFYTLDEVNAKIEELLQNYPTLVGGLEVIGQTHEGRNIFAFKVSDNPNVDEDEPEVLYTALHHAREPESMMQMFYFIQYLLDNYETNDEVKYLIENREMYFIPVVNPDGYAYNEQIDTSGGGMWRKNRSNNGDGTYGVDLNRNYGPEEYWDAPNGGSSTNTSSSTYRGSEPFSEPELIAIREFLNNREIRACLNYHTYSNLLIFPYGALEQETPDSNIFREFAIDMTAENYYSIGTDQQTVDYSTRGNSDDYMYDGEPGREKIFAMTPEVGNFDDGFWPEEDRIIPLAEENLLPNLYYANIVGGYPVVKNIKVDKEFVLHGEEFLLTPLIKNKGLSETGQFEISILPLNTSAEIIGENLIAIENIEERAEIIAEPGFSIQVYSEHNLEELSFEISIKQNDLTRRRDTVKVKLGVPIVLFEDNADSLELFWHSPGFIPDWGVTERFAHSGDRSYTDSRSEKYYNSNETSLTLLEDINLTGLDNAYLSFWTRYQIESVYDGGVLGISVDSGATWNYVGGTLAKSIANFFPDWYDYDLYPTDLIYTGSSYEWQKEEIDLSDYLGESILIRFTFFSDWNIEMDGWYIDDIKVTTYDFTTDVDQPETISYNFELEQNYPNPFNPSTKIKYQIPETGHVSLKVYDLLGREVAELVNTTQSAGNYSIDFSSKSGFSSGIYFYRLQEGEFSKTRKMLLIK